MPIDLWFHAAFVRNIAHYAGSRGVDRERFIQRTGIAPGVLSDPDGTVPADIMERAWNVGVEETGDECFGLHLGEGIQPADIGLVGIAMMSSHTLQAALQTLIRFWGIMSNASQIELSNAAGIATLQLKVNPVPGNFLSRNPHPIDSSFSTCVSLLRAMAARPVPLREVLVAYAPSVDPREYVRVLGVRPRFNAGVHVMTFPEEVLRWPLRHAHPELAEALEARMTRGLNRSGATLRDRVRGELVRRLRGSVPELGALAAALGLSDRALQRGLQVEGATFRQVLDDLRKELAAAHLTGDAHSIAEISFLLGFSEPSVFHRYFRRWYGMTPVMFRTKMAAAQRASGAE